MDEDRIARGFVAGRGVRAVGCTDIISAAAVIGVTVTCTASSGAGLRTVDVHAAPAGVATIVPSAIVFAAGRRSGCVEGHAAGIAPCRITCIESDAARDRRTA